MATRGSRAGFQVTDSDFIYDFLCSPCSKDGKNTEAEYQCVECRTYFCKKCVEFHNKFLATHTLLDKKTMKSGLSKQQKSDSSSEGSLPSTMCDVHPGEVIKMYCGHHDLVCCTVCIAVKHRSCEGIEYIPNVAKKLVQGCDQRQTKEALEKEKRELQQLMAKRKNHFDTLNKQRDDSVNDIQKLKKRLIDRIGELESRSMKIVDTKHRQTVGHLNDDITAIDETLQEVTKQLEKLKQSSPDNETQSFIDLKQSQAKKNVLKEHERKLDESIVYEINAGIESVLEDIESFITATQHNVSTTPFTATFLGAHDIRTASDMQEINVYGLCQLDDNQIIITDYDNNVIKRLDATFKVTDWLNISGHPNRICQTGKSEVVLTLHTVKMVKFVSVGKKLSVTRSFYVDSYCKGISFCGNELYICSGDGSTKGPPKITVYDISGSALRVIQYDKAGLEIFSNPYAVTVNQVNGHRYVADSDKGVMTLDKNNDQITHITKLTGARGVCTDDKGNVFACGKDGVVQMNRKGDILGTILIKTGGKRGPVSVTYLRNPDRLLITEDDSRMIKIYRLNWLDVKSLHSRTIIDV